MTYGTKVDVLSGEPSEHERYVWTTALAMGLAHVYFDEWMAVSRQVVGIPARARAHAHKHSGSSSPTRNHKYAGAHAMYINTHSHARTHIL